MEVIYEDNHLIAVNKAVGEIVQGDKTGDETLADRVKAYVKERYGKPGDVFIGVVHRLDRPVSGVVVMARTSKGLSRMDELLRKGGMEKTYLAIVKNRPPKDEGELKDYLVRNERQNKSYAYEEPRDGAKEARLLYKVVAHSDRYLLLAVRLLTGRHHQIRCQLAHAGCPIRGDLKYGAPRSNPDGGISLHAWRVRFEHPVRHTPVEITAPLPKDNLWQSFAERVAKLGEGSIFGEEREEVDAK